MYKNISRNGCYPNHMGHTSRIQQVKIRNAFEGNSVQTKLSTSGTGNQYEQGPELSLEVEPDIQLLNGGGQQLTESSARLVYDIS